MKALKNIRQLWRWSRQQVAEARADDRNEWAMMGTNLGNLKWSEVSLVIKARLLPVVDWFRAIVGSTDARRRYIENSSTRRARRK